MYYSDTGLLARSLDLKRRAAEAKYYLKWGIINVILYIVFMYDISKMCPYNYSKLYYLEYVAIVWVALSGLACFCKYFMFVFFKKPVHGTQEQRYLLDFDDDDTSFVTYREEQERQRQQQEPSLISNIVSCYSFCRNLIPYPGPGWPNWIYTCPKCRGINNTNWRKSRTMSCSCLVNCGYSPPRSASPNWSYSSAQPGAESPNWSYSPPDTGPSLANSNYSPRRYGSDYLNWSYSPTRPVPDSPNWPYLRTSPQRRSLSPLQQQQQHQQQQHMHNSSWNSSVYNNSIMNNSGLRDNYSFSSAYKKFGREKPITDMNIMKRYLADFARREQNLTDTPACQGGSINSFWKNCSAGANKLWTTVYQLAPLPVTPTQNKNSSNEEGGLNIIDSNNSEAIRRISPEKLATYVGNLRTWISCTILKRLSNEMGQVDESFQHRGFHGVRIGGIGLERLKKTVENEQFVNQYMPLLPMIVPFLEMSSNQEYLVQRIKDLATGSCISNYCWNSGSEYHGLQWDEHLPTDSAIIFHIFCVYLDTQLPPLPQGRPFFSRYVIIGEEKLTAKDAVALVHNKARCAILCLNPLKPKFNFISNGQIHNCVYNRNNLFYVIIQFLIYMRSHQNSCLEGVNLGKSGINIMCVIED